MPEPNFIYRCTITRVVDGDTVDANVDLGFNLFTHDRIRLMGIDTPESRTRNLKEKALGLAAKARLKEILASAPKGKRGKRQVFLETTKKGKGKFGRILGTLHVNDQNVNELLVSENHARPYFGGRKSERGEWAVEKDGVWHRWTSDGYVLYDAD